MDKRKPLSEGTTRGHVKGGVSKPTPERNVRPNQAPPSPTKPKK